MDPRLDFFLARVSTRLQRLRLAWVLAGCWLVLGLGLLTLALNDEKLATSSVWTWLNRNHHLNLWLLATGVALVTLLLAWIFVRFSFLNRKDLANLVEHRYPNLDHRLVTAVEVKQEDVSSFLRRSLIDETVLHAATNDWRRVVSNKRMIAAWGVQFVTLAFAGIGLLLLVSDSQAKDRLQKNMIPLLGLKPKMIVEPGNAEIERGSNCLITVRFDGEAPPKVRMQYHLAEADTIEVDLERSLKDPIFAGYLSHVEADTFYRIQSESGSSPEHKLTVFDYPALVNCDAEIEPPAYSKQPTRLVKNTRRVTVPEGSKLTWMCTVNKPLKSVKLVPVVNKKAQADGGTNEKGKPTDPTAQPIALHADASNPLVYRATIDVNQEHQWHLQLLDEANRSSKVKELLIVKITPNLPPEIKKENAGDLTVSPLEEFTVGAKVREDFELVRAGVSYQLASQEMKDIAIAIEPQKTDVPTKDSKSLKKLSGTEVSVRHMLDFEALGAKPDQLLSYYFWAEDLDRNGNVRRVDGEIYFAEVRPFDEIFREGQSPSGEPSQKPQSPQAQEAEELAELQKNIISGTWNLVRDRTAKIPSEDVKVLIDSQQQAIELTVPLEEKLSDADSKKHLEAARNSMDEAVESLSDTLLKLEPIDKSSSADEKASKSAKVSEAGEKNSSDQTASTAITLRAAVTHEQQAYEALLRLRAREHQIVKSKSSKSKSSSQSKKNRQQQIDQLKLDDEKERYEEERQATSEAEQENRELRQVMNRLEELARRQQDLNRQLKDLETAIQEAKTPDAKKELEEQLKRLRENQEELLRDTDEVLERMQESQPTAAKESMQKAQEQVEEARSNIQQASQALSQSQPSPSQALSAGSRAERQLDETREQLRAQSAERFEETMKSMLSEARQLEQKQSELAQKTLGEESPSQNPRAASKGNQANPSQRQSTSAKQPSDTNPGAKDSDGAPSNSRSDRNTEHSKEMAAELTGGLRSTQDGEPEDEVAREQAWKEQSEKLNQLMERMQETISEAEPSEPLLSEKLYDAFRDAEQRGLDERLQMVPKLVERGYEAPVRQTLKELDEGVQKLRSGIEAAAESVLGSEEAGLKRALGELKEAEKMLNQELANASGEKAGGDPSDKESTAKAENGQAPNGASKSGKEDSAAKASSKENSNSQKSGNGKGQAKGSGKEASSETRSASAPQNESQNESQNPSGQNPSTSPSGSGGRNDSSNQARLGNQRTEQRGENGQERSGPAMPNLEGPFTGGNFTAWSDALREVEESVRDPELRASAAQIREAAREIYRDAKRHSKVPQWDLVKEMVAKPLSQLREEVQIELLRQSADRNAVVPIDRDPVPGTFEEQQRRYYENLSSSANGR